MGVQTIPPANYDDRTAWHVWDHFRHEFPGYLEQPHLDPAFEVFGGPPGPFFNVNFQISPSVDRKRYWFISEDETQLVQYQDDRLLLNWRRRPSNTSYPRFDMILPKFQACLATVEEQVRSTNRSGLDIRQAELSYINMIPLAGSVISDWLTLVKPSGLNIEQLSTTFSEVVRDDKKTPIARLHHEFNLGIAPDRSLALRFSMTIRGAPSPGTIESTLLFLEFGREKIVRRFAELTTEKAHEAWGRLS
jgi:uncharacterized protein (TIGR04255 family)